MKNRRFKQLVLFMLLLALSSGISGCATSNGMAFPIGEKTYPAKPLDFPIEVFSESPPERAFAEITRLNFHSEKTFFAPTLYQDALEELKVQARKAGADAIIDLKESKSILNETKIYNLSAVGIVFEQADK